MQGHYNKVDFGFINNETFTDPLSYLLVDYNQSKTESFQSNGLLGMALATDENGQKHGFLEQVFSNYPNMLQLFSIYVPLNESSTDKAHLTFGNYEKSKYNGETERGDPLPMYFFVVDNSHNAANMWNLRMGAAYFMNQQFEPITNVTVDSTLERNFILTTNVSSIYLPP